MISYAKEKLTFILSITKSMWLGWEVSSADSECGVSSSSKISNSDFLFFKTDFGWKLSRVRRNKDFSNKWIHAKKLQRHTVRLSSILTRSPFLQFLSSLNLSTWCMNNNKKTKGVTLNLLYHLTYRSLCYICCLVLHHCMELHHREKNIQD